MNRFATVLACAIGVALSSGAHAASTQPPSSMGVVIYPAKGQSAQQQDRDRYECYEWARGQSGFDPAQPTQPASISPASASRTPAAMAGGAIGGAAIAELTHNDPGHGAAAGALGAAMIGRVREQQMAQARQQQAAQQQSARSQQRAIYDRAFGACMEARGYTVR